MTQSANVNKDLLKAICYSSYNTADKSAKAFVPLLGRFIEVGQGSVNMFKPKGEFEVSKSSNIKFVDYLHCSLVKGPEGEYWLIGSNEPLSPFSVMRFKKTDDESVWVLDKQESKGFSSNKGEDALFDMSKALKSFGERVRHPEGMGIFLPAEAPPNMKKLKKILDKHEGKEFDLFLKILGENKIAISDNKASLKQPVGEMEAQGSGVCVFELDAPASR